MKSSLCLLLLLCTSLSYAQRRDVQHQRLVWVGYSQKLLLSPRWSVRTELEGRWFPDKMRQQQWVLPRIHLQYLTRGGTDLAIGASYFLHALPQNDEPVLLLRPEWRAHQELTVKQSLWKNVRLEHRYRLEERFMQQVEDNALAESWEYSWRFRYRAQLVIPIVPDASLAPALKVYDEILINAGKSIQHNIFDQNRIGAALSFTLDKQLSADLGYMYLYQQRPSGDAFFSRHIFRLNLFHTLALSQKL